MWSSPRLRAEFIPDLSLYFHITRAGSYLFSFSSSRFRSILLVLFLLQPCLPPPIAPIIPLLVSPPRAPRPGARPTHLSPNPLKEKGLDGNSIAAAQGLNQISLQSSKIVLHPSPPPPHTTTRPSAPSASLSHSPPPLPLLSSQVIKPEFRDWHPGWRNVAHHQFPPPSTMISAWTATCFNGGEHVLHLIMNSGYLGSYKSYLYLSWSLFLQFVQKIEFRHFPKFVFHIWRTQQEIFLGSDTFTTTGTCPEYLGEWWRLTRICRREENNV